MALSPPEITRKLRGPRAREEIAESWLTRDHQLAHASRPGAPAHTGFNVLKAAIKIGAIMHPRRLFLFP
jgi:hypothetical protein